MSHLILLLSYLLSTFTFLLLFFFNDTATTEIYTLSLHDALPICCIDIVWIDGHGTQVVGPNTTAFAVSLPTGTRDRKSTRLNSSHANISYAVFCLKKKRQIRQPALFAVLDTSNSLLRHLHYLLYA